MHAGIMSYGCRELEEAYSTSIPSNGTYPFIYSPMPAEDMDQTQSTLPSPDDHVSNQGVMTAVVRSFNERGLRGERLAYSY